GGKGRPKEQLGGTRATELSGPPAPKARDQAAAALGVSGRAVGQAKRIKEADPEAFERVKAGEVSLRQAERQVAPPRPAPSTATLPPAPAEPTDQEREAFARIADAVSALQREYSQAIEAQGAFLGPLMKTTKGALTAMHHALDDLRRKL